MYKERDRDPSISESRHVGNRKGFLSGFTVALPNQSDDHSLSTRLIPPTKYTRRKASLSGLAMETLSHSLSRSLSSSLFTRLISFDPSLFVRLREILSGFTIAFLNQSVDRSLFTRLILNG